MDSTALFYFDKNMDFQFYLSNEQPETCPYYSAPHKESLDLTNDFEVRLPANYPETDAIAEGGYIGFWDREADFQLFKIVLIEEEDSPEQGLVRALYCRHVFEELADLPVEDKRLQNAAAAEAIDRALELQTKWQRGNVADLGLNSTNFYYESIMEALFDIQNIWGGEIKPRIEIDENNRVTGFYVDLPLRRGSDTGLRIEVDRNARHIKRKYDEEGIKTAIYPRGKGQETGDGYTRRLTIADVEWSTANGDPVDKPLGQEWIGDPDALQEYGIDDGNGIKIHRFGFVNFDEDEDPDALIQKGWETLQELKNPRVQYEASAEALALEGEPIQLGDTVAVVDYNFVPAIVIKARVIELTYYKDTGEINIKLGNFMPAFSKQNEAVQKKLDELGGKTGAIEQGESGPVTDDDFEDITPEAPQNVSATGLFKTISLKWYYDPSYNIAAYEVYGSRIEGFNPDETTLLYRGKTGGFVHDVGATNQQWYYRVRAINPHGTPGPFSDEVSTQTLKINAETDVQDYTITKQLLAQEALIEQVHLNEAIITDAHIAGRLSANVIQVGPGTAFDPGYDPSTKETPEGAQQKADQAYNSVIDLWGYDTTFIDGGKIYTNTITADKINVSRLSALSSNIGTINAGEIYGVYIEGSEIAQKGPDGSMVIDEEGLKNYDANNNLRTLITTSNHSFQSFSLAAIYFEPDNPWWEFIVGTGAHGLGDGVIGFTNPQNDRKLNIWNDGSGSSIELITNTVIVPNLEPNLIRKPFGDFRIESMSGYAALASYSDIVYLQSGAGEVRTTDWLSASNFVDLRTKRILFENTEIMNFLESAPSYPHVTMDYPGQFRFYMLGGTEVLAVRDDIGSLDNRSIRMPGLEHYTTSSSPNLYISGAWNVSRSTSARKWKRDIEPLDEYYAEQFFEQAQPVWYRSKCPADPSHYGYYGYIADDLADIEPRLVKFRDYDEKGVPYSIKEPEGVHYDRIPALLHVVMKKDRKRIEQLERKNRELNVRVDDLERIEVEIMAKLEDIQNRLLSLEKEGA
ncbi:phage minor structural protein [Melghiribacillus thermohalophilus]|uniref:Phage minor structural protein n=1 Tax=Melghiribacillus thermohalophilus TaxID=1324956 RepID=A0A4R3N4S9_9BACI|nr:phage tail spike protein [Melghiribacillus thermohalophilus]TCT23397.1 phage minor structural protein [Melghiribacillus thermohalophilus]